MFENNFYSLFKVVLVLVAALLVSCGGNDESGSSAAGAATLPAFITNTNAAPPQTNAVPSQDDNSTPVATTGLTCAGVGPVQAMSADPNVGAVDVSEHCLGVINSYRSQKGLAPYYLHSKSAESVCCQAAEAKTAAGVGGHANGNCGWKAQGFCGGGRNPSGSVKSSIDWCPKLFYGEGPAAPGSANHYTAMMEEKPRGIMCSFYGASRDLHSVVINYY